MVGKISSYKDLEIWKLGIKQCKLVYKFTKTFPRDELYSLVSQMRRSSVSVPSNIAEGYTRRHTKDKLRFLDIALSSNAELETHLILSAELEFIDDSELYEELISLNQHVGRALTKFYQALC